MKVFVCTGAIGHDFSTTNFVVEEFIKGLIKHGNEDVTVFYANLLNYHIEFCDGSIQPFITGKTQSSDDMVFLEKEMLSSDLIVIASPVYANTVSGSIKTFIDRIAHWTHLFRLCGKYGALFSISSNSGAEDPLNYLNDIMGTMGLSIVCKESFITNTYTKEAIKNILDVQSALVIKKIESGTLEFSHDQEYNFKKYQKLYSNGKGYANELDYWKSNKMFEVESLSQLAKTYSGGVIL